MSQMIITFPAPQRIELVQGAELSLSFPAPQMITLQVEGIKGPPGSGGGVSDGDKGGITVSGSGAVWTVNPASITDLMLGASAIALFAAASHTHIIANVTGLQAALDGKAASVHSHVAADVTDFADTTRGTVLTGYTASGSRIALAAGDTILGAFGKLGKWLSDLAAIAFSGSASDLTAGTLPAARFDDTAHGARAGGSLHPVAIAAGAAGFMSGADKTKLDAISGSNTGDQTSIVGITGTKAQFDAAVTDGNIMYVGDAPTAHTHLLAAGATDVTITAANLNALDDGLDTTLHFHAADRSRANHTGTQLAATISDLTEAAQDAVGAMVDATLVYVDATPALKRAPITGHVTIADGSNAAALGSFTKAQLTAAVSDGDPLYVGDVTTNATHTGDATGSTALTLATVNANVGSFGLAGSVAQIAVNAKGLITSAVNVAISIAASAISDSTAAGRAMLTALTAAAQTALLDVFTSGAKGLAPASGGGTTNFLRADGTWTAPGGGGATNLTYTPATRVIASDTGTDATLPLMSSADAGLVPASGGGTVNFLRADGTFAAPGGGGGSPGGATGEVQYNDAGAFAGAADVEIEGGQLRLPTIAAPTAPAAGGLKLFGQSVGGRDMPAFKGPSGLDFALQTHMGRNRVAMVMPPGNSNTLQTFAFLTGSTGTATAANWAATNLHTRTRRMEYLVTVAATTAVAGFRGASAHWTIGAASAGLGGFSMVYRWAPATGVATATQRAFAGMRNSTAAPTDVEPSTQVSMCGMGWDAADANIQFMHNDASGVATKIDLGASFPVPTVDRTSVYEIALFAPPGTTQSLSYEVRDLVSGAVATGTVTTNLPPTTTALVPFSYVSVGGTSSVVGIAVMGLYIESDT